MNEVSETACIEIRYQLMFLLYRVKCACPIQFSAFLAGDCFAPYGVWAYGRKCYKDSP